MAKHRIQAQEAEEALRDYYASDGRTAGLRASPIEPPDGRGSPTPDGKMTDERVRRLTEHRRVVRALRAIGAAPAAALWLAYADHASSSNALDVVRSGKVDRVERHPDTSRVVAALGNLLGLALQTRALRRSLAEWLSEQRGKFHDEAAAAAWATSEDLAEAIIGILGAAAVRRAMTAAGREDVVRFCHVALAEQPDLAERHLLRVVRDGRWRDDLEAVRREADAARVAALVAFARAAGYPVRTDDGDEQERAPRARPMRLPKMPSWARDIREATGAA